MGTPLDTSHFAIRAAGALFCLQEPGRGERDCCHFCLCPGNASPHAPGKGPCVTGSSASASHGSFTVLFSLRVTDVTTGSLGVSVMQALPAPGSCPRSPGGLCWDRHCPGEGRSAECQVPAWAQRPHCFLWLRLSSHAWFYFTKFCRPKSGSAIIYRQNRRRTTWEGPNARTAVLESQRGPQAEPSIRPPGTRPRSVLSVTLVCRCWSRE